MLAVALTVALAALFQVLTYQRRQELLATARARRASTVYGAPLQLDLLGEFPEGSAVELRAATLVD